ncbi:MAG: amidohydrolase, partial [bacterium]
HGVGLSNDDVARVIAVGATVVWCPGSNLAMLGRTLDPRRLFDAGLLALGTDSRLTGSRDLLDELRVAAALSDLTSSELLRLVTADGARAFRMSQARDVRELSNADCFVIHRDGDPYESLLRTARGDIRAVIRDGVPVIADPDFADWFAHCDVETVEISVDGRPKLAAKGIVRPEAVTLEPGLEFL